MSLQMYGSPYFPATNRCPDQQAWLFVWSHAGGYTTCGVDLRVVGAEFSRAAIETWINFATDSMGTRASLVANHTLLQVCLRNEDVLGAVALLQNLAVSTLLRNTSSGEIYFEVDGVARILPSERRSGVRWGRSE